MIFNNGVDISDVIDKPISSNSVCATQKLEIAQEQLKTGQGQGRLKT